MTKTLMSHFTVLPELCISEIISFTTPADAVRSSVISRGFNSAADSDIVWDKFLPSDHQDIVSRSVCLVVFSSKKDLYFKLCKSPILLDQGKLSFCLDKANGKKCYLLSARQLILSSAATQFSWEWTSDNNSRFQEVAFLNAVDILDIRGKIGARVLSLRTNYAAYLVFKIADQRYHGLESTNAMVRFVNKESEDEAEERATTVILAARAPRNLKGKLPEKRKDGWLEVQIGNFYNSGDDDYGDVEARLLDSRPFHAKCGLIVEGIEFRTI